MIETSVVTEAGNGLMSTVEMTICDVVTVVVECSVTADKDVVVVSMAVVGARVETTVSMIVTAVLSTLR